MVLVVVVVAETVVVVPVVDVAVVTVVDVAVVVVPVDVVTVLVVKMHELHFTGQSPCSKLDKLQNFESTVSHASGSN